MSPLVLFYQNQLAMSTIINVLYWHLTNNL